MFRVRTWFINYAWGERNRVGGIGNYWACAVENTIDVATHSFHCRDTRKIGTTRVCRGSEPACQIRQEPEV